ncbi:MAG: hypothetical protein ACLFVW_03385 [Phycisphaerae bacterium]
MAETIESFVQKLQQDGVEAGQAEAEKIRAEARDEADRIVADATSRAESIVEQANQQAEDRRRKTETELALAARDSVHRLREALNRGMKAVVARGVGQKLSDVEFLGEVLHELIVMYAQSDIDRKEGIEINLPPETRDKLVQWALNEIGQDALDAMHIGVDLKGKLKTVGFEYTVSGGTVEVTRESVVETLAEMISPELQRLLAEAVGGEFQAKLAAEQKSHTEQRQQQEQQDRGKGESEGVDDSLSSQQSDEQSKGDQD